MSRTDRRRRSKPPSDLRARFLFEDLDALGIEHAADLAYRIALAGFRPIAHPETISHAMDCFERLNDCSIPFIVCGGWAADFQLGRLLRDHDDVDLFVLDIDEERVLTQLGNLDSFLIAPVSDGQRAEWRYEITFRSDLPIDLAIIATNGATGSVWNEALAFGLEGIVDHRRQLAFGNRLVSARTLSPELHYLFKLAGLKHFEGEMREKDLADIRAMLPLLNPRRLAEAKASWRGCIERLAKPAYIE